MLPSYSQVYCTLEPPAGNTAMVEVCVVIHWRSLDKFVAFWTPLTLASPEAENMQRLKVSDTCKKIAMVDMQ